MNVVVVATHPDDETLGCGGTLLKHKATGDKIFWVIATRIFEEYGFSKEKIKERDAELKKVSELYGFSKVFELGMPTTKIDNNNSEKLISAVSAIFKEVHPNVIYLPFRGDVHSDHRLIFDCVFSCTKSFRYRSIKKILMMETLSETEFAPALKECTFVPNYFVDISKTLEQKIKIASVYKSEMGKHPFPRSEKNIKALAVFRGASSGCKAAESFVLLKEIA